MRSARVCNCWRLLKPFLSEALRSETWKYLSLQLKIWDYLVQPGLTTVGHINCILVTYCFHSLFIWLFLGFWIYFFSQLLVACYEKPIGTSFTMCDESIWLLLNSYMRAYFIVKQFRLICKKTLFHKCHLVFICEDLINFSMFQGKM